MDFFKRQWKDLSGNIKFWLIAEILGGGSSLTSLAAFWASLRGIPHAEAYLYASLFTASTALFAISNRHIGVLSRAAIASPAPNQPLLETRDFFAELVSTSPITITVLEGHVGIQPQPKDSHDFFGANVWLLLRIRVASREKTRSITEWIFQHSEIADDSCFDINVAEIPPLFRYQSVGKYGPHGDIKSAEPSLTKHPQAIQEGHFFEGFILLDTYADSPHECFRWRLLAKVTDTLGDASFSVTIPSGKWLRPAEFSYCEAPKLLPLAGYLYPPPDFK